MPRHEVPEVFRFLADIHNNVAIADRGERLNVGPVSTTLHYTPGIGTRVAFNQTEATIELDVRYIEDVCDLVSCLALPADAGQVRALLLIHRMALDAAVVSGDANIVVGLLLDYIVSKASADILVPDVSGGLYDLDEGKTRSVAEIAGVFAATHEITHWKLQHDAEYRRSAISRAKEIFAVLKRQAEAISPETREVAVEMANTLEGIDEGQRDLPEEVEELVCDITSASAIARAAEQSANREDVEAVVWSASVVLWARTRIKRLLKGGELVDSLTDIDRRLVLQRGLAIMFCLVASRWMEHLDTKASLPETPMLSALESIVDRSVAAFFDPNNVHRFLIIGAAATTFGVDTLPDARAQIERISGWV